MLGDEDGVVLHGGLLAVVSGEGWGQARINEIKGMPPDGLHAFVAGVRKVLFFEPEFGPEGGLSQGVKGLFDGTAHLSMVPAYPDPLLLPVPGPDPFLPVALMPDPRDLPGDPDPFHLPGTREMIGPPWGRRRAIGRGRGAPMLGMVLEKGSSQDGGTETDGNAFPTMPLFGARPGRRGGQGQAKAYDQQENEPFFLFHHVIPLSRSFVPIDTIRWKKLKRS